MISVCVFVRLLRRSALLAAVLICLLASSCFRGYDKSKVKCATVADCPSGYSCVGLPEQVYGTCTAGDVDAGRADQRASYNSAVKTDAEVGPAGDGLRDMPNEGRDGRSDTGGAIDAPEGTSDLGGGAGADSLIGPGDEACAPGRARCSLTSNGVQTCEANGTWGLVLSCGNQTCIEGMCSGSCAPGATQCSLTSNGVQTCAQNGTWGSDVPCTNQACANGVCTGSCSPGTTQCTPDNGVQTCSPAGAWSAAISCGAATCKSGACAGSCESGKVQCSGNGVQTCGADGTWGAAKPCTNQACAAGACVGSCTPNAVQCSAASNAVQTCSASGSWGTPSPCVDQGSRR